jgi:RHS repeat-associated protein
MGDQASSPGQIIALPKGGGAQRGLGEKFTPDLPTGTGNITVPIAVPPGRNSFQPQLNLVYSTGNGNGLQGMGWGLDIAGVTRKTSRGIPRYQDYDVDSARRDVFILSGAEDLVPVPDASLDPSVATRYRPRSEGLFARIVHHHDAVAGTNYWEVSSIDGLTSYYGPNPADQADYHPDFTPRTSPATISRPKSSAKATDRIFAWKLTLTKDSFGNRIEYLYGARDAGQSDGHEWDQPLLTQIRYADYDNGTGLKFLVTVTFAYEDGRDDPHSDFRAGFEIRTTKRCRSILIQTHADTTRSVRDYQLGYKSDVYNGVSLLESIAVVGFDDQGQRYDGIVGERQVPPLMFQYTQFDPEKRRFQVLASADLPPLSIGHATMELVDLHGAGLPDILEINGRTARYWRNRGNGAFDIAKPMRTAPAGLTLATAGVQLLDANGDGRADLLVSSGPLAGYFPLEFGATWSAFQQHRNRPSFRLDDPEVKLVDLTGDGVTDVIRSGTRMECYFNDPEAGFRPDNVRWVERAPLADFPDVNFSDPRVKLADMTGDGLQDVVLVHSGSIAYWPQRGYGAWGKRVSMAQSPRLPYGYDPRRLLLGDVDGDGVCDLVYVGDREITLWINRSGNGWSAPIVIGGTPPVSDLDALRIADLLGAGISGILWSSDVGALGPRNFMFLDFTGGTKPYLLTEMDNRLGALTRVDYKPSTYFYLEDEKKGATRWRTPLPFPVHVVARVEVSDALTGGRLTTEYRYHHGTWDGAEREFRGFGMVEQTDTETAPQPEIRHSPPTLTKTWFHVGPIGPAFGDWTGDLDWSSEFWPGDPPVLDHTEFVTPFLRALAGNDRASRRARRDAIRTLRGHILRTELYALDGSPDEARPYTVSESQCGLREIDPPAASEGARPRIFFPHLRGQRTTQWERGDDPLTAFTFTDGYDDFGQPTRATTIACPRGWRDMQDRPAADYLATATVTAYAAPAAAGPYIHNRVAANTTYEMTGSAGKTVAALRAADPRVPANIIGQTLNYYDGAAFTGLSGGAIGRYGALARSEELVLTDRLIADALQGGAVPPWLDRQGAAWTADHPAAFRQAVPALGSFVYSAGTDAWHAAGYFADVQRNATDVQLGTGTRGLLAAARDPLGRERTITYDAFALMPVKVTDALQLEVSARPNYRVLAPDQVTDPNHNTTRVTYSPIGLVERVWMSGKDASEGDALRPSVEMSYDFLAFERAGQPIVVRTLRYEHHDSDPADTGAAIETREYSDGFGRLLQTRTQAEDTLYGDATFGAGVLPPDPNAAPGAIMPRTRAAGDPVNVVVSGAQVYDNKGRVIERYEPFFDRGWDYVPPAAAQRGARISMDYDPRGQLVRTVNPDGSEQRLVHGIPLRLDDPPQTPAESEKFYPTPWETYTYDANDNAGRTHPAAAQAYRHHWDTPASIRVDALGRTVEAVERNRDTPGGAIVEQRTRTHYDARGNVVAIVDALGREAFRHVHDLFDRRLRLESIDAGVRLTFFDAAGSLIEARDDRGALMLHAYDGGGRPARMWGRDDGTESFTLRERLDYGDGLADQADAARRNLRGRLCLHADEAGELTLERYDFKGNLTEKVRRVVDPAALADPLFRIDWDNAPALAAQDYRVSSRYDALDRAISVQYPADVTGARKQLVPAYDRSGALARLDLDGASFVTRIAYDAKGQRTLVAYGNGLLTACAYDPATFRLARLWSGAATAGAGGRYQPGGAALQNLGYAYDLAGNVSAIVEVVPGCGVMNNAADPANPALTVKLGAGDALVRTFGYDALYRLTRATGREATNIQGLPPWPDGFHPWGFDWGTPAVPNPGNARTLTRTYVETYAYDPTGNMMKLWHGSGGSQRTRNFGVAGFTPAQWRAKVQAWLGGATPAWGTLGNRLTNFGGDNEGVTHRFDQNGNLIAEFANRAFAWDHADRLRAFRETDGAGNTTKAARYLYDAAGQRVMKRVETAAGVEVTIYIDGTFEHRLIGGQESNTLHVMDNKSRVAMLRVGPPLNGETGPAVQYQLSDHLGSAALVVGGSDAGAKDFINREEHYPHGEASFGSFARKRYRFTGMERDEESGFGCHGARYYAVHAGRWISPDPAGPVDGENLYCYANLNVVTDSDQTGLQTQTGGISLLNNVPMESFEGIYQGAEPADRAEMFQGGLLDEKDYDDIENIRVDEELQDSLEEPDAPAAPAERGWHLPSLGALGMGADRVMLTIGGTAKRILGAIATGKDVWGDDYKDTMAAFERRAAKYDKEDVENSADLFQNLLLMGAPIGAATAPPPGCIMLEGNLPMKQPKGTNRLDWKYGGEVGVDTSKGFPESAPRTDNGGRRDARSFWRKWQRLVPKALGTRNRGYIKEGMAPEIDEVFLKQFPQFRPYKGDLLIHHHLSKGPWAVAYPRRFHSTFHGPLHY